MRQTFRNSPSDRPHRPTVLVVDKQPMTLQSAYQVLCADCRVIMAADGATAIALCVESVPDLVLLDDEVQAASGLEALVQIKAAPSLNDVPVICVTRPADSVQETACIEAGAADVLAKPVNPSVLRARVMTHLLLKFQSEQLRGLSFRDELTGVYSRRYFDEQVGVESARASRSGSVLSLLMIDVDHLSAYKDHYGHQAGSDALHLVARVLESELHRPGDLVACYGGTQFVCLIPATDFEPAMLVAARIEQAVRARGIGHASFSAAPVVTISIGLATRRRALDGDAKALLRLADEQLGQAKQQGGARACGKVLYRSADV